MSSKRRLRRKRCERKIRYATKDEGLNAARYRRRVTGSGTVAAYQCPWCNGWHIGHMNKKMIKAMAQRRVED